MKLGGQAGTPLTWGQGKGQTVSLGSALPLAPLVDSQSKQVNPGMTPEKRLVGQGA